MRGMDIKTGQIVERPGPVFYIGEDIGFDPPHPRRPINCLACGFHLGDCPVNYLDAMKQPHGAKMRKCFELALIYHDGVCPKQ